MGASRFRTRGGLYHYGKVRRTDWIPLGALKDDWELRRTIDSVSSSSGRDSGHEDDGDDRYEGGDSDSESESSECDSRSTESDSDDADPGNYWDDEENSDDDEPDCGRAGESDTDSQ